MKRSLIPTLGALALAAGLVGCGLPSTTSSSGSSSADDTLSVVGPFEVHSLDPATSDGFFTRLQVTETLVEAASDGALLPGLASTWTSSRDLRTWRFTLREGATFHDGTPVTAESVQASLEIAASQEGTPLSTAPVSTITAAEGGVRVALDEPFAPLPAVLAHTSTQVLAPSSYGDDGTVTDVVGSGPYAVTSIEQPARIDVAVADTWDGETPAVEQVSYQAVGRPETRALMAESGQADVTFGMDPVSLQRVEGADGIEVHSVTLPRSIVLKVNAAHPILGEPDVRRALSLAVDREALTTALLRDPEMAATQLFPPSLPEWHDDDLAPLEHDLEQARTLLAGAGWVAGDDDVLERDGERFTVTLRTFPDRPELPPLATALQESFKQLGVELDVRVGNSSEIPAGHQDGSLDLALFARNYALVPDPLVTLLQDFTAGGAGDWGAMGWSDASLEAELESLALDRGDDDSRSAVTRVLQEQLPLIPVAWYRQSAVVADRVTGFDLDPLERSWQLADLEWAP